MDHFKFFETSYFQEIERKQRIENSLSTPIGAIAAAFGVLGYYFTHFQFAAKQPSYANILEIVFLAASLVAFCLLCISAYWCVRLAISSTYEYLPGSETLRKYHQDLKAWYLLHDKKSGTEKADQDFHEYLIGAMAFCSQKNWQQNNARSEILNRAKLFTAFALGAVAIAAVGYYLDFWYNPILLK